VNQENRYFRVTPKVVLADTTAVIKIEALHVRFREDAEYELSYYPLERFSQIYFYLNPNL
jgi:hypothetical protein